MLKFELYSITSYHTRHLEQMVDLSGSQKTEMPVFCCSNGGTPTQLHTVFMTWIKGQWVLPIRLQGFSDEILKAISQGVILWALYPLIFSPDSWSQKRRFQITHSGSHGHQKVINWLVHFSCCDKKKSWLESYIGRYYSAWYKVNTLKAHSFII